MRYQDNLGDFDVLIDFSRGPCIPEIKKAGADEWVRFPKASDIDILGLVHTDLCGVTFALCSEWITETEEKILARLARTREELEQLSGYDYVIYSRDGKIGAVAEDVYAIVRAEGCRMTRNPDAAVRYFQ